MFEVEKFVASAERTVEIERGEFEVLRNDLHALKSGVRFFEDGGKFFASKDNRPAPKRERQYVMPYFADEVRDYFNAAVNYGEGGNLLFTGPAGTGKTEFVYAIAREFGMKVFQINGSDGLVPADFIGQMTVKTEKSETGALSNFTAFEPGILYRAFVEGTKLDENGKQVLDENGNAIPVGKPGVFFLDEFAAVLPQVLLGVFNRALEVKDGVSRSLEIYGDGGECVKSHPGLIVIFAGNTAGNGCDSERLSGYSAQDNDMDESTLSRFSEPFEFGYNREAERAAALNILNDDREADRLLELRDRLRRVHRDGNCKRLFSTRHIVNICAAIRKHRRGGKPDVAVNVLRNTFAGLPSDDKHAWNEAIRAVYGVDCEAIAAKKPDYDYF